MPEKKRILIVGGVAGGASAAARLRRLDEDCEIVMFERGENISFANCGMPYHIGGTIADRKRLLVQTPEAMRKRYRIDVRTRSEVIAIDRAARQVTVRNLATGQQAVERYDALILSPGAEPVRPPIPGSDSRLVFALRSLSDMDAIQKAIEQGKPDSAVVVGGGYIGLEMAEALRQRNIGVTMVELARQAFIAADAEMVAPVHEELRRHGVDLRLGTSVTAMREEGGRLALTLCDGQVIRAGLAILAIGVRPEAKLAKDAGLDLGVTGGILVDEHMRTSDPAIYAVGDAVEVTHLVSGAKAILPLAGPANRQGRIAADNICGVESTYRASQGTAICKVFDLAIGMTGLSEKGLQKAGLKYEKIYVHPASHASYYPGAAQMSLKLLFDPQTGKVLGAQAVGSDGVDKRIDVLAVAIRAGLTVQDLEEQELCYAPPYGSAKDPINYAAFVAGNVMRGRVKICHVADVQSARPNQVVLDVRMPAEIQAGAIPGAMNIPLDDLRERLGELPKGKEILVTCQVGLRGYLACRILTQKGFNCRNLSGGYKTYKAVTGMMSKDEPPRKEMTSDTGAPAPVVSAPKPAGDGGATHQIDARGQQCPGPIMQLKIGIDKIETGQTVAVLASDPAFGRDVAAWCHSTGHKLIDVTSEPGFLRATIQKNGVCHAAAATRLGGESVAGCSCAGVGAAPAPSAGVPAPQGITGNLPATDAQGAGQVSRKKKTLVVFSGDLDKALAAFIIANGAVAMGSEVTMFFTFWGLNILRRAEKVSVSKNLIERMFGWMMPRGAAKLKLSNMHMAGMGAAMIKGIMRKKNVQSLPELIEAARKAGVRLVACSMSMDLMGIKREELIEGVEEAGVALYLDSAEAGERESVHLRRRQIADPVRIAVEYTLAG